MRKLATEGEVRERMTRNGSRQREILSRKFRGKSDEKGQKSSDNQSATMCKRMTLKQICSQSLPRSSYLQLHTPNWTIMKRDRGGGRSYVFDCYSALKSLGRQLC